MIVDLKSYRLDFLWFATHDTAGATGMYLWYRNESSEKTRN